MHIPKILRTFAGGIVCAREVQNGKQKTLQMSINIDIIEDDILNIDRQLYSKYGLNNDEISFIEEMIRPME